jgi:hypothetical protein
LPSHFFKPLQEASSAFVILTQEPPAPVQLWHAPQLACAQHRPSTQFPLTHSEAPPAVQLSPSRFLQAPAALHVPLHWLSSPERTGEHCPLLLERLQAWQATPQASLQQTPSTQKWLVHSLPDLQERPAAFCGTQAPVSSQ